MTKTKKRAIARLGSVKRETRSFIVVGPDELDGAPLYRQEA